MACYGSVLWCVTVRYGALRSRVTAVRYSALRLCVTVCYGALRRYVPLRYAALL